MDGLTATNYLKDLHDYLISELQHVYNSYLKKHLQDTELSISPDWERDKKSLIVFSHAAIENYIEMISLTLIKHGRHDYVFNKRVSDIILNFLWLRSNSKPEFSTEEWGGASRPLLIKELDDLIDSFANEITINNHGIKIKHLNNLLRSVSIDLPENIELLGDLDKLTDYRGEFAHRFLARGFKIKRITNTESPETVKKIIINCYRLSYRLYIRSLSKINCIQARKILDNERDRWNKIKNAPVNNNITDLFSSI